MSTIQLISTIAAILLVATRWLGELRDPRLALIVQRILPVVVLWSPAVASQIGLTPESAEPSVLLLSMLTGSLLVPGVFDKRPGRPKSSKPLATITGALCLALLGCSSGVQLPASGPERALAVNLCAVGLVQSGKVGDITSARALCEAGGQILDDALAAVRRDPASAAQRVTDSAGHQRIGCPDPAAAPAAGPPLPGSPGAAGGVSAP